MATEDWAYHPGYAWPPSLSSYIQPKSPPFMLGGWQCPSCGRCWNPLVISCAACQPQNEALPALPVTRVNAGPLHDLCIASACPPSRHGAMCGCEEDDEADGPPDCRRARCDH